MPCNLVDFVRGRTLQSLVTLSLGEGGVGAYLACYSPHFFPPKHEIQGQGGGLAGCGGSQATGRFLAVCVGSPATCDSVNPVTVIGWETDMGMELAGSLDNS